VPNHVSRQPAGRPHQTPGGENLKIALKKCAPLTPSDTPFPTCGRLGYNYYTYLTSTLNWRQVG
jgi:hypothetical protein